jgi:hypothetical protein
MDSVLQKSSLLCLFSLLCTILSEQVQREDRTFFCSNALAILALVIMSVRVIIITFCVVWNGLQK